jgi:hypothetical protein
LNVAAGIVSPLLALDATGCAPFELDCPQLIKTNPINTRDTNNLHFIKLN